MDEYICEYCNQAIEIKNCRTKTNHLKGCVEYKKIKKIAQEKITKEWLIEENINKHRSVSELAKELRLKKSTLIYEAAKRFGIELENRFSPEQKKAKVEKIRKTCLEKYGYADHLSCPEIIKKREQTCLQKYGVTNVFAAAKIKHDISKTYLEKYGTSAILKSNIIKEKINQTNINKYGAKNPFQSVIIREKIKKTCLEKYGVDNPWKAKDVIKKCQESRFKNSSPTGPTSKLAEECFLEIYNKLPEKIKVDCRFLPLTKEFGKYGNNRYNYYDFVIPSLKFCIEFNGNYWHANPELYEANHIFSYWDNKMTAQEVWNKDKLKYDILINEGFNVNIIWEKNYRDNKEKIINEYVNKIITLIN